MKTFLSLLSLAFASLLLQIPASAGQAPDVSALRDNLSSDKPNVRASAAEALGALGPLAAPAVPALIAALDDTSPAVQVQVLVALGRVGPASRAAIPSLVAILKGSNSRLYERTMETLGAIGPDAAEAVLLLVDFIKGDDPQRALAAAVALARILAPDGEALRDAIPVLVDSLKNNKAALRGDAVRALGLIGPQALPALIPLVEEHATDSDAAWHAEVAMEWMGSKAEAAIPALVKALESQKEKVALHAAAALGAIGPAAKDAAPALQKSAASKISQVRAHSASALGAIGADDEATVAVLVTALKDGDEHVRRESAEALGKLGPAARAAVPVLIATLDDAIGSVTMHAAQALAHIGPDAVPELIPILKREDRIRHLAVLILGELGPAASSAVDDLTSVLSSDDQDLVREAILALSRIGAGAKPAVPGLLKILGNQKSKSRGAAAYALANLGAREAIPLLTAAVEKTDDPQLQLIAPGALVVLDPEDDEHVRMALPVLIEGLDSNWMIVRHEAALALRTIGPRASVATAKLTDGLRDDNVTLQIDFLWALAAIGRTAAPATPEIVKAMSTNETSVRSAACYALGSIGPDARVAIPALEKNLLEQDDFVKLMSAWALVRINRLGENVADECLPALLSGLKLPDPRARKEAAQTLALLGPAARAAVPSLQECRNDEDAAVREAVAEALRKIGDEVSK